MNHADLGGGGDAYFTYDASGKRVRKVVVEVGGAIAKERIYLGSCELFRRRVSGDVEVERSTLHIHDGARRVAMVETLTIDDGDPVGSPVDRVRYQLDNHLGSACLELDGAALVISYEEYHPYGTTSYRASPSGTEVSAKRYRYNGKERDEETGLYDYGARYYAAWLGRWTTADPLGVQAGLNVYLFCRAGPVNYVDPDGRQETSPSVLARAGNLIKETFIGTSEGSASEPNGGSSVSAVPWETSRAQPSELPKVFRQSLARIEQLGVPTSGFGVLFDRRGAPVMSFGVEREGSEEPGVVRHGSMVANGPAGKPILNMGQEQWDQLKALAERGVSPDALRTYHHKKLGHAIQVLGHELAHHALEQPRHEYIAGEAQAIRSLHESGLPTRPMGAKDDVPYSRENKDVKDLLNYTHESLADGVGVQLAWGFRAQAALAMGQPREMARNEYQAQLTERATYGYVPARKDKDLVRGPLEVPSAATNPLTPWAQRVVDSIVPRLVW